MATAQRPPRIYSEPVTVLVTSEMKKRIKAEVKKHGPDYSTADLVRAAIDYYLALQGDKK